MLRAPFKLQCIPATSWRGGWTKRRRASCRVSCLDRRLVQKKMTINFPEFGLTPEQRREAVFGHRYEHPGMYGARGEVWCYTDAFSYAPGAAVRLQVSSSYDRYRLPVLRDGAIASPVLERVIGGARR